MTKIEDSIGTITLNHGKVNTLSRQLIEDMCEALGQMKADSLQVVVLRAAPGAKVFSAGHDVRELPTNGRDPLTYSDPLRHVIREIESHPAAIIAMVEGSVWGGACELVMACDLVIAARDASFALTPARLGIPYNLSGTLNFLKVAGMHLVKEMLFTAEPMSAGRLAAAGVINHVVSREELEAVTMDLAKRIIQTSPLVHRILKEELRVLGNAHPLNPEAYERIQSLRREVYDSNDYQEGIRAFFEKRKPVFRGK
ncbi:MAG TPA: methylmalonyl-CoA decarboxylase [Terriglobales bacterium]|nr:methylmalonyl-CoA decarboxylase [Terriglobales bacterium]